MEHAPHNAMDDPDEIARFRDRCSVLMGALLDELATTPDTPRTFGAVEDALGWPHRRIASILGGVWRLRHTEFGGRRPYHFLGDRDSASGRWEIWMDATQAAAVRDDRAAAIGAPLTSRDDKRPVSAHASSLDGDGARIRPVVAVVAGR
ncbi:MAG TPA: hypothetical protein VNT03_15365 [Baekduia sp.]|nr:hypothetical protein [Baekduia sp.]